MPPAVCCPAAAHGCGQACILDARGHGRCRWSPSPPAKRAAADTRPPPHPPAARPGHGAAAAGAQRGADRRQPGDHPQALPREGPAWGRSQAGGAGQLCSARPQRLLSCHRLLPLLLLLLLPLLLHAHGCCCCLVARRRSAAAAPPRRPRSLPFPAAPARFIAGCPSCAPAHACCPSHAASLRCFPPRAAQVFIDSSMPVIQHYEERGKVGWAAGLGLAGWSGAGWLAQLRGRAGAVEGPQGQHRSKAGRGVAGQLGRRLQDSSGRAVEGPGLAGPERRGCKAGHRRCPWVGSGAHGCLLLAPYRSLSLPPPPSRCRRQVARINADRPAEEIYKEVRRLFMEF